MDVVNQAIGPQANVKVSISGGKLTVTSSFAGQETSAATSISCDVSLLITELEAKTSSTLGQEALALLAGAVKAVV